MIRLPSIEISQAIKHLSDQYKFSPASSISGSAGLPTHFQSEDENIQLLLTYAQREKFGAHIAEIINLANCVTGFELFANDDSGKLRISTGYVVREGIVAPRATRGVEPFTEIEAATQLGIPLATKAEYRRGHFSVRQGDTLSTRTLQIGQGYDANNRYALDSRLLTPTFGGADLSDPVDAVAWMTAVYKSATQKSGHTGRKAEISLRAQK